MSIPGRVYGIFIEYREKKRRSNCIFLLRDIKEPDGYMMEQRRDN
jgi:hypothetical protein